MPSELLSGLLMGWQEPLRGVFQALHAPWWLEGALVDGVYRRPGGGMKDRVLQGLPHFVQSLTAPGGGSDHGAA